MFVANDWKPFAVLFIIDFFYPRALRVYFLLGWGSCSFYLHRKMQVIGLLLDNSLHKHWLISIHKLGLGIGTFWTAILDPILDPHFGPPLWTPTFGP
jgi:hypothetical protein